MREQERAPVVAALDPWQEMSLLRIVAATCSTAVDALRAGHGHVDSRFVADLAAIGEQAQTELERLTGSPTRSRRADAGPDVRA